MKEDIQANKTYGLTREDLDQIDLILNSVMCLSRDLAIAEIKRGEHPDAMPACGGMREGELSQLSNHHGVL